MLARCALSLFVVSLVASQAMAAPQCEDPDRAHAAFTKLLAKHVKDGLVDYAALKRDAAELDRYVTALARVCDANYNALGEQDKLAFWLNLYNATTLKLVLSRLPFARITELDGGKIFDEPVAVTSLTGAASLSLNAIENERVRKQFKEPRIHVALVCAAKSCPPLREEAYRGKDLDAQLDDQLRRFLKDSKKNSFDAATKTLFLSKIFEWYRGDFEGGLGVFVARVYGDAARAAKVQFLEYDWSLNAR